MNVKPLSEETRMRLLQTAGEIFAGTGFHAATIRKICAKAGVNVASVNYHFGSKEDLYAEVLEFSYRLSVQKYPGDDIGKGPPRERLLRFVEGYMLSILDEGQPAWLGKLIAHEMIEPTAALDRLVEKAILPKHRFLAEIVREIAGPGPGKEAVSRMVFSIIGQCLFYNHCKNVITRIAPAIRYDAAGIKKAAEHVTGFSIGALKCVNKAKSRG